MKRNYCKNCTYLSDCSDRLVCNIAKMNLSEDEIETIIVALTLTAKDLPMYSERATELLNKLK